MSTKEDYKTEWCLLQNQFDSYEKHSLYIKLSAVVVNLASSLSSGFGCWVPILLLVLWLQDAIWKTFQTRIESRILRLEQLISRDGTEDAPFQFNSEFEKRRGSSLSLFKEYLSQSIRPTVAFPHVVLVFIVLVQLL